MKAGLTAVTGAAAPGFPEQAIEDTGVRGFRKVKCFSGLQQGSMEKVQTSAVNDRPVFGQAPAKDRRELISVRMGLYWSLSSAA